MFWNSSIIERTTWDKWFLLCSSSPYCSMISLFCANPTLIISDFLDRSSGTLFFNCGKQAHSSSSPLWRVTPILPPFTHGPLLRTPCACSELEGRLLLFSEPRASSWDGLAALFITRINLLIITPPPPCKTSPLTSGTINSISSLTSTSLPDH